jgi:hypothetical protein
MARRITYDHATITYWPSGKTHSGDRVCVKAAEEVRSNRCCSELQMAVPDPNLLTEPAAREELRSLTYRAGAMLWAGLEENLREET